MKIRLPVPVSRSLRRSAIGAERIWTTVGAGLSYLAPRAERPIEIRVLNALTLPEGFFVEGRILARQKISEPKLDDSSWRNFQRLWAQWLTHEIPKAEVEIHAGNKTRHVRCDRDGYFSLEWFNPPSEVFAEGLGLSCRGVHHSVTLESPAPHDGNEETGTARYAIISDIDDTLIETGAVSTRKMVATTIFGNSLTRKVVSGMPKLLGELKKIGKAPLFYITSSPWNLQLLLQRIFERAGYPDGGRFMTEWGITVDYWLHPDHRTHKEAAIQKVLDWYPGLPLILFGDDSQYDPEIYGHFLKQDDERIMAVFIRQVGTGHRRREVRQYLEPFNREDRPALVIDDSLEARRALRRILPELEAS